MEQVRAPKRDTSCMSDQLQLFTPADVPSPAPWLTTTDGHKVCNLCCRERTPEGHDPCIARTPGVLFACCSHGVRDAYVVLTRRDGPQTETEYERLACDRPGLAHTLRGETLHGREATTTLRELRREGENESGR